MPPGTGSLAQQVIFVFLAFLRKTKIMTNKTKNISQDHHPEAPGSVLLPREGARPGCGSQQGKCKTLIFSKETSGGTEKELDEDALSFFFSRTTHVVKA